METNEHRTLRHLPLGNSDICSSSDSACDLYFSKRKGRQMSRKLFPVVVVVAATIAGCSPSPATVFSIPDRAGLGAFLAFEIVGNAGSVAPPAPDGGSAPAGSWCDECTPGGVPLYPGHPGKVGDGTVFNTCPVCNGTQKVPGSVEEEMQQLEDLQEEDELTFEDVVTDITDLGGTSWTIEDKRSENASDAEIREHLVTVHGIDPDSANKMDREELLSLHNLLHNTEIRTSAPTADCPSGTCPVNASGGSSCPTCPSSSSSSSSSRSRGLFGRRR